MTGSEILPAKVLLIKELLPLDTYGLQPDLPCKNTRKRPVLMPHGGISIALPRFEGQNSRQIWLYALCIKREQLCFVYIWHFVGVAGTTVFAPRGSRRTCAEARSVSVRTLWPASCVTCRAPGKSEAKTKHARRPASHARRSVRWLRAVLSHVVARVSLTRQTGPVGPTAR